MSFWKNPWPAAGQGFLRNDISFYVEQLHFSDPLAVFHPLEKFLNILQTKITMTN